MLTHSEILFSFLEELNGFERHIEALLKSNREQIKRSNECLSDTRAQQGRDDTRRNNHTFLR